MKVKHKLLGDYQYITPDKKIFLIKTGTIIEEYCYKIKNENIIIDKDIVKANPEIFSLVDWKSELLTYIKQNKIPQPAVLSKKLIPFIEDMVLSSYNTVENNSPKIDISLIKELEEKETELFKQEQNIQREKVSLETRDKILKDKEDDILVRLKRIEKKEEDLKSELSELDKKDDLIREKNRELIDKGLELEDKIQDLNERERNLNSSELKSSEEIDLKYKELQSKIDSDLADLSNKEKELELKLKELSKRESNIEEVEDQIKERLKELEDKELQFSDFKDEILKLDTEIKNWEEMHWKLKRNITPPSAILETRNPNIKFM
jgi:DNA repair exonuclease SbcCD ATPase subunit